MVCARRHSSSVGPLAPERPAGRRIVASSRHVLSDRRTSPPVAGSIRATGLGMCRLRGLPVSCPTPGRRPARGDKNVLMRYFRNSFLVTIAGLILGAFVGYEATGTASGVVSSVFIVAVL